MQKPKVPKLNYSMLAVLGLVLLGMAFDNSTDFDVGSCSLAVAPLLLAAAPAAVSAIGAIGSSIFSGIFGKSKQKAANQAQIQLANQMFDKESKLQWDMWNATNNHNDASAQVKRLMSAGINPALALQSVNTGNAQSMTAPKHNMPNIIPEDAMANAMGQIPSILGQSFGQYMQYETMLKNFETQDAQNKLVKAQAAGVDIENQYKERQILAGLEKVWADTGLSKVHRRLAKQEYDWINSTKQLRYTMLENENSVTSENVNWLRQQIKSSQIRDGIAMWNEWNNHRLTDAKINELAASASNLYAAAASVREAMHRDNHRYWSWEQFKNDADLDLLQKSSEHLLLKLKNDGLISEQEYERKKSEVSRFQSETYWYQFTHGANPDGDFFSGIGSTVVGGLTMASQMFGNIFGGFFK